MPSWKPHLFDFTFIHCIVANVGLFAFCSDCINVLRVCEAFQVCKLPDIVKCHDLLVWGFQQVWGMTLVYFWCAAGCE